MGTQDWISGLPSHSLLNLNGGPQTSIFILRNARMTCWKLASRLHGPDLRHPFLLLIPCKISLGIRLSGHILPVRFQPRPRAQDNPITLGSSWLLDSVGLAWYNSELFLINYLSESAGHTPVWNTWTLLLDYGAESPIWSRNLKVKMNRPALTFTGLEREHKRRPWYHMLSI